MEYVSPNIEVNLFSEDGKTMHKFYPHKKYASCGYDGNRIYVETKEHKGVRFSYNTDHHPRWSNATSSGCKIG